MVHLYVSDNLFMWLFHITYTYVFIMYLIFDINIEHFGVPCYWSVLFSCLTLNWICFPVCLFTFSSASRLFCEYFVHFLSMPLSPVSNLIFSDYTCPVVLMMNCLLCLYCICNDKARGRGSFGSVHSISLCDFLNWYWGLKRSFFIWEW